MEFRKNQAGGGSQSAKTTAALFTLMSTLSKRCTRQTVDGINSRTFFAGGGSRPPRTPPLKPLRGYGYGLGRTVTGWAVRSRAGPYGHGLGRTVTARVREFRFFRETSNGRLPLKHGSDRPQTWSKRVSDDPRHFIFRRPQKLKFCENFEIFERPFTPRGWLGLV